MTPADYDFLRRLVKDHSGLALGGDKQYLVESRLLPVSRRLGLAGLKGLMEKIRQSGNEALVVEVVEAMATNESLFFRDKIPFDHSARPSCRRCWHRARSNGESASGVRPPPPVRSLIPWP